MNKEQNAALEAERVAFDEWLPNYYDNAEDVAARAGWEAAIAYTLRTANQRLEREVSGLKMAVAEQSARSFVGRDDQRHIDDLVAAGIRASDASITRLEGEVARLEAKVESYSRGLAAAREEAIQQYTWRAEDSECGGQEVLEGIDALVGRIDAALRGNGGGV